MLNKIHTQIPHTMGQNRNTISDEEVVLKPIDYEVYLEMKHNLVDFNTMTVPVSTLSIANKLNKNRRTIQKSIDKLIKANEIEKIGIQGTVPIYKFFKTKKFEKFSQDFIENHRNMPDRANYIALQEFGKKENNFLYLHKNINSLAKEMHISAKALIISFNKWEKSQILTQSWEGNICSIRIDLSKIGQTIFSQILENTKDIVEIKNTMNTMKTDIKTELKKELLKELKKDIRKEKLEGN